MQWMRHPRDRENDGKENGKPGFAFACQKQSSYPHGSQMCTTACMQVGMAILCRQLDLRGSHAAFAARDTRACTRVSGMLNWCMNASSTVHGRVEALLAAKDCEKQLWGMPPSRMVSVNELVRLLGISMDALHVSMHEFFICSEGLRTRAVEVDCAEKNSPFFGLRYRMQSCFISLTHLPVCMQLPVVVAEGAEESAPRSDENRCAIDLIIGSSSSSRSCVALLTGNFHTVCAACYYSPQATPGDGEGQPCMYAVFDPMPGRLWVGLTGPQMVLLIQEQLGIPSSVVPSSIPFARSPAESGQVGGDSPVERKVKIPRKGGASAAVNGIMKKRRAEASLEPDAGKLVLEGSCRVEDDDESDSCSKHMRYMRIMEQDAATGDGHSGNRRDSLLPEGGKVVRFADDCQQTSFYCDVTLMHLTK